MTESDCSSPSPRKSEECKSSYRKSNKPLMEKRRRARINTCLTQLKSLVLQAMKKDNAQYSKLEKADILELTVKHLRHVQRHQMAAAMVTSPDVVTKYRAGFNECAGEVMRYLTSVHGINDDIRTRVLGHLANCLQSVNNASMADTPVQQPGPAMGMPTQHPAFIATPCPDNPSAFQTMTKEQTAPLSQHGVQVTGPCLTTPLQLIPGTLPTGQVAFVLTSPSPVQAVPLYASSSGSSERKTEMSVKQETAPPVSCNGHGAGNTSPSYRKSPVNSLHSKPPTVAVVNNQSDDRVWRPW